MAGHCTRIDVALLADGGCRVIDDGRGIPVDINPEYRAVGGRDRAHHAARRREVRRRRLQGVGRPARRRRVRGQRPVPPARGRGRPRRQAPPHGVRRRRPASRTSSAWSARRPGAAPAPPSRSGPTRSIFETIEFTRPHHHRAVADDGVPQQGPRDPLQGRAAEPPGHGQPSRSSTATPAASSTSSSTSTRPRSRCSPRSATTSWPRRAKRSRSPSSGTPATRPTASTPSPTASTPSRAAPTRRGSRRPHRRGQPLRPGQDPAQGEGREPARRGHPGGADVDHLGAAPEPQFEGQTKAKLGNTSMKTLVQRATNEKLGDWLEENPTEANKLVKKALAAAQARMAARKARDVIRTQDRCSTAPACPTSSRTAPRATGASASCSSSRATRPAVRRSRPATPARRRSCPSAARSSTSSGPASTGC